MVQKIKIKKSKMAEAIVLKMKIVIYPFKFPENVE